MREFMKNASWTSILSALLLLIAVLNAVFSGSFDVTAACGLSAIALAVLSLRDLR